MLFIIKFGETKLSNTTRFFKKNNDPSICQTFISHLKYFPKKMKRKRNKALMIQY